jgi:hypothetical protein
MSMLYQQKNSFDLLLPRFSKPMTLSKCSTYWGPADNDISSKITIQYLSIEFFYFAYSFFEVVKYFFVYFGFKWDFL